MYSNPAKITKTGITNKINYDVLIDDTQLLADIQALFPTFPNKSIGMKLDVYYEGGVDSQISINNGRWNDFINGNRYDTGGSKQIVSARLSQIGTEYTVAITFE